MNQELSTLRDDRLLSDCESLRSQEKAILYQLLLYLGEVDERKLYLELGYSSFFAWLTTALGYSKAAAYRRVEASRLLRKCPELYQKLTSGELSFSSLVELAKCKGQENLYVLVEKSVGKSREEVSQLVQLETAPVVKKKAREKVRVVKCKKASKEALFDKREEDGSAAEPIIEIAFQTDSEFMKLYQEARALAGGKSMEEVFRKILREFTKRKSPKERVKRRELTKSKREPSQAERTRHIPIATKDAVFVRDGGCCSFVGVDGKRCDETEYLEVDHIVPYAKGGVHKEENLRLLCRAHNQMMAEKEFGRGFMNAKRGRQHLST